MKRILFIGDDRESIVSATDVLQGRYGDRWELVLLDSRDAVDFITREAVDAIVCDQDVTIPEGAGHVLSQARFARPAAARLLWCDSARPGEWLPLGLLVQRCVPKPDADALGSAIERAIDLQDLLACRALQEVIDKISDVPPAPGVYQELAAAMARPEVPMQEIVSIVERDAALCVKALRIVNSGLVSTRQPISNLKRAILYIGLRPLNAILLGVGLERTFSGLVNERELTDFQDHAVSTAYIARKICPDHVDHDDAFLAALMHDVGRLVLAGCMRARYQRLRWCHATCQTPCPETESDVFGVTHAEVGAYVLSSWNMPAAVIEAVAHHHEPSRVRHPSFDLVGVTHVAEVLAHRADPSDTQWDLDFLRAAHLEDKLEGWRDLAEDVRSGVSLDD